MEPDNEDKEVEKVEEVEEAIVNMKTDGGGGGDFAYLSELNKTGMESTGSKIRVNDLGIPSTRRQNLPDTKSKTKKPKPAPGPNITFKL